MSFNEKIKAFTRAQLLGKERDFDQPREQPSSAQAAFKEQGLAHWWLSRQVGGQGVSLAQSVDAVIDLAYGDAGFAFSAFIPILSSCAIELFATDQQREKYLRPMATGASWGGATMASESMAGSELLKTSTVAEATGNGFALRGEKYFSTNAGFADYFVVYAKMSDEDGAVRGFIVPKDSQGIRLVRRWNLLGVRSAGTYEVSLDNVQVSNDAVIEGPGLRILESSLNGSRTLMAASAIGVARRARDLCMEYAKNKSLGDGKLLRNDVFGAKIAQMDIDLDVMRQVCITAAKELDDLFSDQDAGELLMRRGALRSVVIAKVTCGQLGVRILNAAAEMFGGLGYTEDSLIGKLVRDVRYAAIVEAGEDVLRSLVYNRHSLNMKYFE